VLKHFLEVEQPALLPLPSEPFGLFQVGTRSVHPDGHIEVDGAFYSVPHTLVGELVRAQWDAHLVRIYTLGLDGERQAIAVHLAVKAGTYSTRPEQRPLHRPARQQPTKPSCSARSSTSARRRWPGPKRPLPIVACAPIACCRA
jgi:hypothetical protein